MVLFLLVDTFLGFAQNSFEERQATSDTFQKSFAKIREKYQPKGRKRLKFKQNSACTPCLQKSCINSKAFGVNRRKTCTFNILY
jgi:hypothetical protein